MNNKGAHICPWWMAYTFDNPLRRLVHDPARIIGPYVGAGGSAADIGCGMGYFTLGMAAAVGREGTVFAVDIQKKMLDVTMKRAARRNLSSRIRPLLASADSLNLHSETDFILIFWSAHEFPDRKRLFRECRRSLRREGKLLLTEPRFHVGEDLFRATVKDAEACAFRRVDSPPVALSRTSLFEPDPSWSSTAT